MALLVAATAISFLGIDIVMELISSLIAMAVAYYAALGYKATLSRALLYLNLSFSLLGCGMFVDSLLTGLSMTIFKASQAEAIALLRFSTLMLYTCEIIAFSILVFSYIRQRFSSTMTLSSLIMIVLMRGYMPTMEAILIVMLLFISIQAISSASTSRTKASIFVSIAFLLLCLSHVFFMIVRVWLFSYIIAHSLQLLGFIFLLAMLLAVRAKK
ncbi:MAG: hypothetical protein ACXQTI_00600 [Candidatus Nezhaarchaeales archaeon]